MDIAFQFLLDNCKILICNQFFSACFIIESLVSNENVNRIFMIDICENNELGIVILNTFCFQLVPFQRLIDISSHTYIIWLDPFFFQVGIQIELTERILSQPQKFQVENIP